MKTVKHGEERLLHTAAVLLLMPGVLVRYMTSSAFGPGDDLCEWITADEVAELSSAVYGWEVEATADYLSTDDRTVEECAWSITPPTPMRHTRSAPGWVAQPMQQ